IPANFTTVPYEILIEAASNDQKLNKLLPLKLNNIPHFVYVSKLQPENPDTDYFAAIVPVKTVLDEALEKIGASLWITLLCLILLLPLSWFYTNPIVRPIYQLSENSVKVKDRRYSEIIFTPSHVK